ncbi:MAG: tyrosine-type recombinase/integrase [Acidimicrobiia bacterium]
MTDVHDHAGDPERCRRTGAVVGYTDLLPNDGVLLFTSGGTGTPRPGRALISESLAEVNGHFHFGPTKTHQDRVVVVPKFVTACLERHLEERVGADASALVFTSGTTGPLRYSSLRRRHWDRGVEKAGLESPLPVHSLRHTYASLAAQAGASVKMIQTQLGHRDPR